MILENNRADLLNFEEKKMSLGKKDIYLQLSLNNKYNFLQFCVLYRGVLFSSTGLVNHCVQSIIGTHLERVRSETEISYDKYWWLSHCVIYIYTHKTLVTIKSKISGFIWNRNRSRNLRLFQQKSNIQFAFQCWLPK